MPIDPRVLCCASGACCEPGSAAQIKARAEVSKEFKAAGIDPEKVFWRLALLESGAILYPPNHEDNFEGGAA